MTATHPASPAVGTPIKDSEGCCSQSGYDGGNSTTAASNRSYSSVPSSSTEEEHISQEDDAGAEGSTDAAGFTISIIFTLSNYFQQVCQQSNSRREATGRVKKN